MAARGAMCREGMLNLQRWEYIIIVGLRVLVMWDITYYVNINTEALHAFWHFLQRQLWPLCDVFLDTPDAVDESVERRLLVWKVGSSNLSEVKAMVYNIHTYHYLA